MIASSVRRAACLLSVAVVVAGRAARAGDGAAAAEVLFAEGKRLLQDGNVAAACPKFEESQRLDPGIGTLYWLGDCHARSGRTASAWAAFVEVAAAAKAAGQQARFEDANRRAEELAPKLARILVRVSTPDVAGLTVRRGESTMGRGQWGTPLPVDPGAVTVEATAPGRRGWRTVATVRAGELVHVEVPDLPPEDPHALPPRTGEQNANASSLGAARTAAIGLGAAGVVGIGLGGVYGLLSLSAKNDADERCDAANVCDARGVELRDDARARGNVATVATLVGAALATAGGVLWLTAPRNRPTKAGSTTRPTLGFGAGNVWARWEVP